MIAICVAIFSIFTAAAGMTTDPVSFSLARLIAGLGIGGVLPIATAQVAEFAPVSIRARLVAVMLAGYAVGDMLVAVLGKQLIETYGWQAVFYAAALPVLLIPLILKTMPESMPFLIKMNRDVDLRNIARKLVPSYPLHEQAQFMVPVSDKADDTPIAHLFREGRGFSTVMIWAAFFFGLFMLYALSSWLTKLMALAGYSLGSALNFVLVYNIGAIVGAFAGAWLGDKLNIKYVLVAFYALSAASLTAMGYTKSTELLFVMVFIVGAWTLGTQLIAYGYAAEFYPMAIRSTGVGFTTGVGRTGAIVAPILIGGLVALKLPLEQNFMAIGLAGLLGMIAVILINHGLCASAPHKDAATEAVLGHSEKV